MNLVVSTKDTYVTANSYLSLSDIDSYPMGDEIISGRWKSLTDGQKQYYLILCSSLLDNMFSPFLKEKTDEDQRLKFPRNEKEEIPDVVKIATFEILLTVLDDKEWSNVSFEKVGELEIKYFMSRIKCEKASYIIGDLMDQTVLYVEKMESPYL